MPINPLYTAQAKKRGVRISNNTTRIITRGNYNKPFDEEYRENTIRTKITNGNPLHTVVPTLPPGSLQRARKNNTHIVQNTSTCEPGTSGCLPFWPFSGGRGGKTRRNRNKRNKTRSSRRV
ncbi:hypothetical protein EBV26_09230 [bacterium]|nr:hypothetical protein [bacterium]